MKHAIDAIYKNGTFHPVERGAIAIADGQRVRLTVDDEYEPEPLRLAMGVYDGLSGSDIDEIERIALDRGDFFGGGNARWVRPLEPVE
jgi:predicted DNA-binding antitoxin AbrB/MazE fold protein